LPDWIEVYGVQLPGRGRRLHEQPYTCLNHLVEAAAESLLSFLDRPFALFGHSLGAIIVFELARRLQTCNFEPEYLFVSGRRAPHLVREKQVTYNLSGAEFLSELRRLKGTPEEVLSDPETMNLLLPMLRADFGIVQNYSYTPGPMLNCPIRAFGGLEDDSATPEQLTPWREHTTNHFALTMGCGDHFSVLISPSQILETIAHNLSESLLNLVH